MTQLETGPISITSRGTVEIIPVTEPVTKRLKIRQKPYHQGKISLVRIRFSFKRFRNILQQAEITEVRLRILWPQGRRGSTPPFRSFVPDQIA
jgi:hypothetical protein